MSRQDELREALAAVVSEVVEDHPGPTIEVMAADIADSLIKSFSLSASKRFIIDGDEARPVERVRYIDGRMTVDGDG